MNKYEKINMKNKMENKRAYQDKLTKELFLDPFCAL